MWTILNTIQYFSFWSLACLSFSLKATFFEGIVRLSSIHSGPALSTALPNHSPMFVIWGISPTNMKQDYVTCFGRWCVRGSDSCPVAERSFSRQCTIATTPSLLCSENSNFGIGIPSSRWVPDASEWQGTGAEARATRNRHIPRIRSRCLIRAHWCLAVVSEYHVSRRKLMLHEWVVKIMNYVGWIMLYFVQFLAGIEGLSI